MTDRALTENTAPVTPTGDTLATPKVVAITGAAIAYAVEQPHDVVVSDMVVRPRG